MSLTLQALISGHLTSPNDLASVKATLNQKGRVILAQGTAAGQADRLFSDTRTLAASASEDLDLAGGLTDPFGVTLGFARIKGILVIADAANVNDVLVGGASSNAFVGPFGASTHKAAVRPGGMLLLACRDAVAWPVTAGTGDLLKIANSAGTTAVTYKLVIIGASA